MAQITDELFYNPDEKQWRADVQLPMNRGFSHGDGVFETIAVVQGRLLWPALHLQRANKGLASLGLPFPFAESTLHGALQSLFEQVTPGSGLFKFYIFRMYTHSTESSYLFSFKPMPEIPIVRHVNQLEFKETALHHSTGFKSLSWSDYLRNDRQDLHSTVVFKNSAGQVTEGTRAALLFQKGKFLFTTAGTTAALPSVSIEALSSIIAPVKVWRGYFDEHQLRKARWVALMNVAGITFLKNKPDEDTLQDIMSIWSPAPRLEEPPT